ncbi:MAG: regulatory iron-sulfur-containing complex subunit RicT [Bacteriovoracaceae bacterium]|jgi:cell fate regulator YaaT (PSP1 superfamily)|nr:hypothetical protein [Halobacteriovoraceae bacterium]MDP7320001.1 regulatory iron-sulfur-containing complex subunit RicT [Bacteriovoracaceae bacterium]
MNDIQENTGENNHQDEIKTEKRKKNKFAVKEEITEDNCKFTEGQILRFVRVRFPGHAKSYAFLLGQRNLAYGKKVMAMSDRGMAVGYINSFPYELAFHKDMLPLRSITKAATEDDISNEIDIYKKQKEIETLCQNLIEKHKLDMNLTHVEFTQFGKKVVFYFVAPARVDFRGLVKDLVSELKLRIELRQISVRDRAASQGAIGPCGRELCCSSFLSKYGNVSIKMAKNQNLSLNYSKLNGVCGQLKCCLQYEDEVYAQKRKKLPQEGSLIKTKNGDSGKVKKLNILSQQFDLLTDKGRIKRYTHDQLSKTYKNGEYKFPTHFDNISDETATVVGLNDLEAKKTRQFEKDMDKLKLKAKQYAHEAIEDISDFLPPRDRSDDLKQIKQEQEQEKLKSSTQLPEDKSTQTPQRDDHGTTQNSDEMQSKDKDDRAKKTYRHPKKKNYNRRNNHSKGSSRRNNKKPNSSKD